jgi:type III secretion protein J
MRKIPIPRFLFLALLLALVSCGSKVELLKDISEIEANDALAALLDGGISAEKLPGKEGVVSLAVEKSQFSEAMRILNSEGLPHERYAKMGDVFRKEGLISSPLEERARYLWALSQELQATVSQIDGVVRARVHVVLPERASGTDPALPSSAAVFIKYKSGYNLDDSTAQIKRLVSNSIPGLSADKVTVVMLPATQRADAELAVKSSVKPEVDSQPDSGPVPSSRLHALEVWAGFTALLIAIASLGYLTWRRWRIAFGSNTGSDKENTSKPQQKSLPTNEPVVASAAGKFGDEAS